MVFGGQDLTQYRIQAVEEHLRHAPQGERGGQGYHLVIVATHVQAGKQRAGRRHHHGHGQQDADGQRNQTIQSFLGVFFFQRAHDLGHQHGVEDAAGHQREHGLGNHGTGLIGVGRQSSGADGRSEKNRAELTGHTGSSGSRGHDQGITTYG